MAKLIGQITYPQEAAFSVEYVKLYGENDSSLLEFRLINRGKKTVNAYRVDLSYSVNGEEKREAIQGKNLELKNGSTTDVITVTLNGAAEEGTLTLSAVIYDDLSHNQTETSYPFASFDAVSRVAEKMLSGGTTVTEAPTQTAETAHPAKESLMTIAKGESTAPASAAVKAAQEQISVKKSHLPLILALSALGGIILTFILRLFAFHFIAPFGETTLGEMFLIVSLVCLALFTACAALALTAILIRQKKTGQSVAVLILSILTVVISMYFTAMYHVGLFLMTSLLLAIVFLVLALVKKDTALLVTTLSMIIAVFLLIGLFGGCISCGSEKSPDTPQDNNNSGVQTEIGNPVDGYYYLCLEYTSNGDGTCYVSRCSWMGSSAEQPESPHEFAIIGDGADVTIPEYAPNGDRVIAIGEHAFYDNEDITSITLPLSVKTIHANAFSENSSLLSVNLGSVETIGNSAFINCNNLETVTGLDSLSDLQAHAFYSCRALQSISLSGALRTIGEYALSGTGLTSVTVPYNVTSMGEGIFENCYSLVSAAIDCSVSYLPANTFRECSSLETVSLPYGMIEIGESAFEHSALAHITLPETIERIETAAFFQCQELERVFIPYATTSISNNAFYECSSLHTVYWGRTEGELGYVSIGNSNQDLRDAPNQYFGFYNVYFSENDDGTYTLNAAYPDNREEFVIPDTAPNGKKITVISNRCFKDNQQLQTITIPLSVTKIDFEAFDGCVGLKKIIYEGSEESWNQIDIAYGNEKLRTAEIEFLNIAYEQ